MLFFYNFIKVIYKSSKFNESIFELYLQNQLFLLDIKPGTGETAHWVNSGMIKYLSRREEGID